jgi:hypothetical protein
MGEDAVMTRPTLRAGERGQILVFTAVSLVALMGIAALSIDAAYLYDKRNKLYAAADAAAKAAAFAKKRSPVNPDLYRMASHEVSALGFSPVACGSTGGASLCVYHPPVSGPFTGNADYVEAVVSEQSTATFFGRILGWSSASPGARAVAGVANPTYCMIIHDFMEIGNTCPSSPGFLLNGCGLAVGNGGLNGANPNSCIEGTPMPPVDVGGPCTGTCSDMGVLTTNTGVVPDDPLKNLPAFANPYPSCGPAVPNGSGAIDPGCYDNVPAGTRILNSGRYYITGSLNVDDLDGSSGVFIYLAGPNGQIKVGNGAGQKLKLTALNSAPYAGIAVFQARGNTNEWDAKNQFTLTLNGAIYMPDVDIDFKNGVDIAQTNCSMFIVNSFKIKNGSGTLNNSGCAAFTNAAFLSVTVAE